MRATVPVTALCLSLTSLMGAATLALGTAASATTASSSATPATPAAPGMPATPVNDVPDAAARHAKRTGCLKEARAKKLVGAAKTAYIKSCVASP